MTNTPCRLRLVRAGTSAAMMLTMAMLAHAAAAPVRDAALSSLLKAQTQAFSEAGQTGNGATMARLLDATMIFTRQTGGTATKQDLVEGASPPPANTPTRHIQVTD